MIKQIVKALNSNEQVHGWLINENTTTSCEAFFVKHALEMTRMVDTTEVEVTVYHKFEENNQKYLGSSTFLVSHKLSKVELEKLISDAVMAASFIKNKEYNLVKGLGKKTFKAKANDQTGFELINEIAEVFINASTDNVKFNSLEVFNKIVTIHTLNSEGVDLKKTSQSVMVEAIPSYNGEEKVELYKAYNYNIIDFKQIQEDATLAIQDVTNRYYAKKIPNVNKIDVILRNSDAGSFFSHLISDYSYAGIYKHQTDKVIGDAIQKDIKGETLTIGMKNSTKTNAFDHDGVLVKPVNVIENGIIKNYYGNNQYASYLGLEPTGYMNTVTVNKGHTTAEKMKQEPHLEIIALSGIQIESYSGYIGGEVRLAIYFDGKESYPVSGFSFSGNIDNCLSNLTLSKEVVKTNRYEGPKYVKLVDMDIL